MIALLAAVMFNGQIYGQERVSGSNTHYDLGDWISYTVLRYVHSIAIGDRYLFDTQDRVVVFHHHTRQAQDAQAHSPGYGISR